MWGTVLQFGTEDHFSNIKRSGEKSCIIWLGKRNNYKVLGPTKLDSMLQSAHASRKNSNQISS